MKRIVEPEWLDELPVEHPNAIGSRRDLVLLNGIMGHAPTMLRLLKRRMSATPPRCIVEIGAGDGTFMLRLARRLAPRWPAIELVLVDFKDAVKDDTRRAFDGLGWKTEIVAADVFDFLKKPATEPADIMFANLFLHQFSDEALQVIFRLIGERTRFFAACEPLRSKLPLAFSSMVGFIGCNAVTRYDAPLSVRAGFNGHEISKLWPGDPQWRLEEGRAKLFTHTFCAERIGA
jgi:hypothetical protein